MAAKNYDKDHPPIDCSCGCTETEHRNVYTQEGVGEVEYKLHCKACGAYLGYFVYGHWEF